MPVMRSILPLLAALLPAALPAAGEAPSIWRGSPALDKLIAPGTKVEVLATGFDWSEGPVWDRTNQCLLFSDVPRNTIYRWPAEGEPAPDAKGVSIFMKPSGFTGVSHYGREPGSNGLAFDKQGRLLCCEHGDRRVSIMKPGDGKRTLADQFDGKRFNSPNDLAIHSNGDVYFTDPPYGLPKKDKDPSRELPFFGVFRVTPEGGVSLVVRDLVRPNGVALSPDEKTLYVAQSHREKPVVMAYPIKSDGNIGDGKVFFDTTPLIATGPGLPDGLKVRASGHVFTTGPGGVLVIDPKGKLLGRVLTGRATANVAFGGQKGEFLYITADDALMRVALADAGGE
jgi:gluconolactonase